MKAYCPDCGSATEYSLEKPKFCASCGSSFSIASSAPSKKIFKTPAKVVIAEYIAIADAYNCDVGFINAILDKNAKSLRPDETLRSTKQAKESEIN